jgi:hypothetical protein
MPKISHSDYALRFITSVITHSVLHGKYEAFTEELNKHIKTDFVVSLPATSDGQPDWDYMESYMKAVMEESEKSLENLKKTDDTKHLIDTSAWGEFRIGDLFEEVKAGYIGSAKKIGTATKSPDADHTLPLTCAKYGNCGIMYYGRESDYIICENVLAVIRDGAVSTGMVYAEERASVYSHSYFIKVKNIDVSFLTNQYLSCVLTKNIYPRYYRDDTCIWDRIKDDNIKLPITSTGKPDWQYMEDYMQRIMDKSEQIISDLQIGK